MGKASCQRGYSAPRQTPFIPKTNKHVQRMPPSNESSRAHQPKPTCFPVHKATGLIIAGCGTSMCSPASPRYDATRQKVSRSKKMSRCVMRYAAVRKSWVAATRGSPFLGVTRLYGTAISCHATTRGDREKESRERHRVRGGQGGRLIGGGGGHRGKQDQDKGHAMTVVRAGGVGA